MRRADDRRMRAFALALVPWAERFRALALDTLPLRAAHERCCREAEGVLSREVSP